jgi:hypothetical protein
MGLLLDLLNLVLPDPEEVLRQLNKNIPLFSEITPLIQISKFRYFSAACVVFLHSN